MKKKIFYSTVMLILLISGCKSITIQESQGDYTQNLKGKIKSLKVTNIGYKSDINDTTTYKTVIFQELNDKNNPIKQIDYYRDNTTLTGYFSYNKAGLLTNTICKDQDSVDYIREEYLYNKNNLLIEYKNYYNEKLSTHKFIEYNSKGNKCVEKLISGKNMKIKWITLYDYNYKEGFYKYETLDSDYIPKYKVRSIVYFDNKGYWSKYETYTDESYTSLANYWTKEYDNVGNLVRIKFFDGSGNLTRESYYVNTYDSLGNIIKRDHYRNNRISETIITEITYKK